MIRNIIFDLDGTLIDSAEDIYISLKKAYIINGVEFSIKNKENIIGPPLTETIIRISPFISQEKRKAIISTFRKIYDGGGYPATTLMCGVNLMLKKLYSKGIKMYIVTNKRREPALSILSKLKIDKYFIDVLGTSPLPLNENKMQLVKKLLLKYHIFPTETFMIGDMPEDIKIGKKYGIYTIAFLGGYGNKSELLMTKPHYTIKKMDRLYSLVINFQNSKRRKNV